MARPIDILSTRFKALEGMKDTHAYIGKKVFSKSGEYVGVVRDILMNQEFMTGILVSHRGLSFIDKEYIASTTGTAIMLSIDPVVLLMGKHVFDSEGRKLGKVIGIERKSSANTYSGVIVRKSIIRKPFVIPHEEISVCKTNIILKGVHEQ